MCAGAVLAAKVLFFTDLFIQLSTLQPGYRCREGLLWNSTAVLINRVLPFNNYIFKYLLYASREIDV